MDYGAELMGDTVRRSANTARRQWPLLSLKTNQKRGKAKPKQKATQ
jgi:hypothetical protein